MDIDRLLKRHDVFQHKVINPQNIPFSQSVADACRANACGKYGTCWTCPPGVGEYLALEKKIKTYDHAFVFTCKYDLEDCFDFEGMMDGQQKTMAVLHSIADSLHDENQDFMLLGCAGCTLCKKCTYPDAPCRFPEKAVVSVEACGIDVVKLASQLQLNYNNGANTVTYFCVVLLKESL